MESVLLDAAGHRRSTATMPGYHRGRPPRNKGEEYPADPPPDEEIVAVMRAVRDRPDGHRLRALIVLLCARGYGSVKRSRSKKAILTTAAALCSFDEGRAASTERSGWTAGRGISSTRGSRAAASSRSARCCV